MPVVVVSDFKPKPRPSFTTWIEWAKFMYAHGVLSFGEFSDFVDAKLREGDPSWHPTPGGLPPAGGGTWHRSFEEIAEARAYERGVYV